MKTDNLLFRLDTHDYNVDGTKCNRVTARGLIKKDDKYALLFSKKNHSYEIPGGGQKKGEDIIDTLKREVNEESGLVVISDSIKYFGSVREIRRGKIDDVLDMISHYFLCEVRDIIEECNMEAYEKEYGYELCFISLAEAIANNEKIEVKDALWIERDTMVLKILLEENI